MQVVSSTEFATHHDKYLDMAVNHDVCIKKGQKMFRVIYEPRVEEQAVLQPDDDLRRAITMDELLVGIKEDLREMFSKGKQKTQ